MKHTLFIAAAFALCSLGSCNNESANGTSTKTDSTAAKTESKTETNKKTAMSSMEGINAHDIEKTVKDGAANFVVYQDGTTPAGNLDSTRHILGMVFNSFPDFKGANQVFIADGNYVLVISDWTSTFKNDMGPVKATGKTAKYKDIDIFTFDDNGKVTSHRSIYPTAAIMMQLGADMSKMQAMAGKEKKQAFSPDQLYI